MKHSNPNITAGMWAELQRRRDVLKENIHAAQQELAKVEYALSLSTNDLFTGRVDVAPLVLTPAGTIRSLPERVVELLEQVNHAMSISEMAEVWFSFTMPMTPAELKRRLSVTTSAIYRKGIKNGTPLLIQPSGWHNPNREIYWAKPSWMDGERVKDEFKPTGPIMESEKPKPPG